jgi:hypothetical protein
MKNGGLRLGIETMRYSFIEKTVIRLLWESDARF